jgi:uncharacterized membrane protein YfhO
LGCDNIGNCINLEIGEEDSSILLNAEVPAGIQTIEFKYITPGLKYAWIIFWSTLFFVISSVIFGKRLKMAIIHL